MNDRTEESQAAAHRDILLSQFETAADLYKHEDSLNWSKLNHFLYITAGLAALLSYAFKNEIQALAKHLDPLILIAVAGVLSSAGFSVAIIFGVLYMLKRKAKLIEIDLKLKGMSGVSISAVEDQRSKRPRYMEISPTILVLILLPVSIGTLWVLVLLALLHS